MKDLKIVLLNKYKIHKYQSYIDILKATIKSINANKKKSIKKKIKALMKRNTRRY